MAPNPACRRQTKVRGQAHELAQLRRILKPPALDSLLYS
jgi:hypothetical protein